MGVHRFVLGHGPRDGIDRKLGVLHSHGKQLDGRAAVVEAKPGRAVGKTSAASSASLMRASMPVCGSRL